MRDDLDTSVFGTHRPPPPVERVLRLTRRQPDTWLGRRLAFFARRFALRRLDGPVDTQAMGVNLRLYPFSNICEKRILFTPQFFDAAERALIRTFARDGFVFLDVGANVGGYAIAVAQWAGPDARILAVEPQPDIFERLAYNIGQNPGGTVKAIACALADIDGEATLFLHPHNRGQAGLKFLSSTTRDVPTVRVRAMTLLTLAREEGLTRIDAAKIDVEGAEDLILAPFLAGAPKGLLPRLLVVSRFVHRWQVPILPMLADRGYRQVLSTPLNFAFARD